MKKFFPLIIIAIFLIAGVVFGVKYLNSNTSTGKVIIVELKEDGFVPNNVRIKKGDTVEFKTILGKPFWPASNLHPTHGIFPEFDPKDAIMPDKTWSFTFKKEGQWGFHDHLAPYYTGKIIVSK